MNLKVVSNFLGSLHPCPRVLATDSGTPRLLTLVLTENANFFVFSSFIWIFIVSLQPISDFIIIPNNMKQRLLIILLTLLTTMTARAQGVTPIEVNDFDGLKTAIESAKSSKPVSVVMTADITQTGLIQVVNEEGSIVSLDLNGHECNSVFQFLNTNVSFTITDNSAEEDGSIKADWTNQIPIDIEASGCSLTITGGNIIAVAGVPCIKVDASDCNLTMTGVTLTSPGWSGNGVVEFTTSSNDCKFTMSGGKISGGKYSIDLNPDGNNTFIVSGNPVFEGSDLQISNVRMSNNPIEINGTLGTTTKISIYLKDIVGFFDNPLTSGLGLDNEVPNGLATNFSINGNSDLGIVAYAGELYLGQMLATNDAGGTLGKWCSYYNSTYNMRACSGVTAYKAKINAAKTGVVLTELFTDGGIIEKNQGVLLKSDGDVVLMNTDDDADGDYTGNKLMGADDDADQGENDGKCYVLSKVDDTFGFFLLESGVQTKAHKAYLIDDVSAGARGFLSISSGDATAIDNTKGADAVVSSTWYTLDGRRLQGKPKEKGVYARGGQKFIVK